ncbi:Hypothetical Protein FCC1311_111992 [Hondaea fermentalgiana]|uniref:Methyltransferase domain-containing protein n=1 Tax=Hondaea fermentalgiana TaxID=2315210 RepID=A0A2R5GVV8_9STRA|nr:Hypothetical Protein FCC1311_111992 [Hondaea fermentalgiana]|eukprot:GBG34976.1 Hypothetical Protein FCC1311_111992 [Hondaea fermentalgiana]
MSYAPLDPAVFADSPESQSTWINLGLWTRGPRMPFEEACQELAVAVGSATRLGDKDALVIDVGCGCGDSLDLWRRKFACSGKIYGVNVTEKECQAAREKVKGDADIEVICEDGASFVRRAAAVASADVIVSGSQTLDSATTQRPHLSKLLWNAPLHMLKLLFISASAGTPLVNLLYSKDIFDNEQSSFIELHTRVKEIDAVDISHQVFAPFASHMWRKSIRAFWSRDFTRAASLVAVSLYMRWLGWCGAVEMVLYRWEI